MRSWVSRLNDEIHPLYSDLPVLLMSPLRGMCDAVSFNAAAVFVSMQTGNTVFLALGASYLPYGDRKLWLRAIVSLGAFWLGCFLFSKLRYLGAKRKTVLCLSFFLQAVFIFVSAALGQANVSPSFHFANLGAMQPEQALTASRSDLFILLPLGFLGFQSGGQIVMSRTLQVNEIPVNVLTSLYCDFLSDPKILARDNVKRNRRVIAIVSYFGGVIGSGWLQRSSGGVPSVLWIAGGIKFLMGICWLFWASKEEKFPEEKFPAEKVLEEKVPEKILQEKPVEKIAQ